MMITFKEAGGGSDIYIAAHHVVAVRPLSRGCDVFVAVARSDDATKPVRFQIDEPADEIVGKINASLVRSIR